MIPQAKAAGNIDPDRDAVLTVRYCYDDEAIPGATFDFFHIASVNENVEFALTDTFRNYPVKASADSVEAWNQLALTLKGYAQADGLLPDYTVETNENGEITIEKMKTGLYLVVARKCVVGEYTYTALPSIVCLPGMDDDDWNYHVTICPKLSREKNPEDEPGSKTVSRKVIKVWDDEGFDYFRPKQIVVHLLKDGEIYDTITLNEEMNWEYYWEKLPECDENLALIEWSVTEESIEYYDFTVEQVGITFVLDNHYKPEKHDEPHIPQTGLLWWPVPVLLCSGMVCLIIGVARRRRSRG